MMFVVLSGHLRSLLDVPICRIIEGVYKSLYASAREASFLGRNNYLFDQNSS